MHLLRISTNSRQYGLTNAESNRNSGQNVCTYKYHLWSRAFKQIFHTHSPYAELNGLSLLLKATLLSCVCSQHALHLECTSFRQSEPNKPRKTLVLL